MTYVVTENCINCKFQDCVAVCPVDCFYEGPNFLVIHPDECIDCGVCEPECPADAIRADTEPGVEEWLAINARYAELWPNITEIGEVPADAREWNGKPGKRSLLITGDPPPGPRVHKPVHPAKPAAQPLAGPCYEADGALLPLPPAEPGAEPVTLAPRPGVRADGCEVEGLRIRPARQP